MKFYNLLHVEDLVLHLFQRTLRLRFLKSGLHQLSLQLQNKLLRVSRVDLLNNQKESELKLDSILLTCHVTAGITDRTHLQELQCSLSLTRPIKS